MWRAVGVSVLVLAACENGELRKLPAPLLESQWPDARPIPPPPPPPLPPWPPANAPAPPAIAEFLRAHATDEVAWEATVYALADDHRPGPRFAGLRVRRKRAISPPIAAELAARLARDGAFWDSDIGCLGLPWGLRLTRKGASLDLVIDCGHCSVGSYEHQLPVFSEPMIEFLHKMRDSAGVD